MKFDKIVNAILEQQMMPGVQGKIWDPWAGESSTGGFTSVDYEPLVQKHIGDQEAFNQLPPEEQNRKVNDLIDDFARQANIDPKWSNDVKAMALNQIMPTGANVDTPETRLPNLHAALMNMNHSNQQSQEMARMSPEDKQKKDAENNQFWQNKEKYGQLSKDVDALKQQEQDMYSKYKSGSVSAEEMATFKSNRKQAEDQLASLKKQMEPGTSQQPPQPSSPSQAPAPAASVSELNQKNNSPTPSLSDVARGVVNNVGTALYNSPIGAPVKIANELLKRGGVSPSVSVGLNPPSLGVGYTTSKFTPANAYNNMPQTPSVDDEPGSQTSPTATTTAPAPQQPSYTANYISSPSKPKQVGSASKESAPDMIARHAKTGQWQ